MNPLMSQPRYRTPRRCLALGWVLLVALLPILARAEDDVVLKAMRDELERSMQKLQIEQLEKPYFIAYTVQEGTTRTVTGSLGSLLASAEQRARFLTVEVRVGDYNLDNTNFFSLSFGGAGVVRMFAGTVPLPLEDDYKELRRAMWLATDGAYKKALEDLARKRAVLQNRPPAEQIPDFSHEEPANISDLQLPGPLDASRAERLVRDLSALLKTPDLFTSRVQLRVGSVHTRYVNSEGTTFMRRTPSVAFTALAETQAADGLPLEDFVVAYGRSLDDLPPREALASRVREMAERLGKLRGASQLDRYSGPVLFEGQAAAEVFSQVFAPRLLAVRPPIPDNPQFGAFLSQLENPFVHKVGGRVLPGFLSVVDNPTRRELDGQPLVGGYRIDDEGVIARETRLVEKGVLKTLLATRTPAPGLPRSTGNRRGAGVLPTNLIVTAENGLSEAELRQQLLALAKQQGKEYAIVVRRLGNPALTLSSDRMMARVRLSGQEGDKAESPILAFKVFFDGREELIRNVELEDLNVAAFRNILAASSQPTVYSAPFVARAPSFSQAVSFFEAAGSELGAPVVSFVVPSLLFEDLSLRKPTGQIPTPPVTPHPLSEKPVGR